MAHALYVVIPTAGRAPLLARTLASLASCDLPDVYAGTLVVENGAKGQAEQVVRGADERLRARYQYVERANKSHALNQALAGLDDGLVVYFDDDVRIAPDVLQRYADAAAGTDGGCFYGGSTGVDYEAEPPAWLVEYLPRSMRGMVRSADTPEENLWFLGFNWAAFVQDVKAVGGYDEARGPGTGVVGQEHDMQRRLQEAGVKPVYLRDVFVWHYVTARQVEPRAVLRRTVRQSAQFGFRAHAGPHSAPVVLGAMTLALIKAQVRAIPAYMGRNEEERFSALREVYRRYGRIKGYVASWAER